MRIFHPLLRLLYACAILFTSACGGEALANEAEVFLSDVFNERVFYHYQGWGGIGINQAVVPPDGRAATPLQIGEQKYDKGLGTHAPSEILVDLAGEFASFRADAGLQTQAIPEGSIVFQVFVDDRKVFDSGILNSRDPIKKVEVPLEGADILRLVVTDSGDGITCDCANWANACLVLSGTPRKGNPSSSQMDIAPFAHVVTSAANRNEGTHSNRVQEFHPDDIYLEQPVPRQTDGTYEVPIWTENRACIGLTWAERRFLREVGLVFPEGQTPPKADNVTVQYWTGESHWQGKWVDADGKFTQDGNQWTFRFGGGQGASIPSTGTEKIRWIWPSKPIRVQALTAISRSRNEKQAITLESEPGYDEEVATIEAYNGHFPAQGDQEKGFKTRWDLSQPKTLDVVCTSAMPWKTDRTVLNFSTPRGAFAVSMEDILNKGGVYVQDFGILASLAKKAVSLKEYKKSLDSRKKVLDQVREMPDQTFEAAFKAVHNPIQNLGPMMLSLACDNWKFAAHREGMIEFDIAPDDPHQSWGSWQPKYRMHLIVENRDDTKTKRFLEGEWLPIPVTVQTCDNGITIAHKTFVAPLGEPLELSPWSYTKPLCLALYTVENPTSGDLAFKMGYEFSSTQAVELKLEKKDGGIALIQGSRVIAFLRAATIPDSAFTISGARVDISHPLASGQKVELLAAIPGWEFSAQESIPAIHTDEMEQATRKYWEERLSESTQIDIPDPLLSNIIRASQVHCMLAARRDPTDGTIAAWIASDRYGPLESEAHSIVLGMSRLGHEKFAQGSLDYFIKKYNPQGFLTTGYTLMGTGWHLWTLAEHFDLWRRDGWLSKNASEITRVCRWIAEQTRKTRRPELDPAEFPEMGLFPPGVAADWNRFAYRFALQGHFSAGLSNVGRILAAIGDPNAASLQQEGENFRQSILKAYQWSIARTPAVQLKDGVFVPASPSILYCFGPTGDIFPGEDGNRSWCYDVELGSHHLVPTGVIDPGSPEVDWMIHHLEDNQFLASGMGDYPGEKSQADWFNLGGFSKVQPYYTRIADVYALRDEVKPFIRSYFNAIPSLVSLENLSFWEHFHNIAAWNKTHETGWFLSQTRTVFVKDDGNELWLAPFVTSNWLDDGEKVAIKNAPTHFGTVSYTLTSSIRNGKIQAEIECPSRSRPEIINLRLRHPEGLPMKSVLVNGEQHKDFDATREIIRLAPGSKTLLVEAHY